MKFSNLRTQGFAATRTRLGLSQSQLAEQLGISRTAITMAETGRRKLPTAALIKLAGLEIKMAAVMVPDLVSTVKETDMHLPIQATPEFIKVRELQCDMQIQKLTNRLESMTAHYKAFHTQLCLMDGILAKESGEPRSMFIVSMQIHRERIIKQLSKCSLTGQSLLRNKIALLSAESLLNRSVREQCS
jgi:transcriptional regulator with XRE-family HTH domain